ncbi:lantibiotic dehydratase family protein [Sinomicrobium kalidii]|uniref:lantibiotic dehydratase n=1 Tax=Sinomicrobium kalidii TaxID=2900738 RepID=UPI001E52A4EA|nr:lantibiotic dehydratase [Sinomicrobium kalidii]UGU16505.1 lantibiotic dehydratase family protein [Sinomicrobium kalidii]
MSIRIFPHSLVRYAGMDYRDFESFTLKNTASMLEQYLDLHKIRQYQKDALCDGLYQCVAETDDTNRQLLIDLKRRIFNDRKIPEQKLLRLKPVIPAALWTALRDYLELLDKLKTFDTDGSVNYRQQLEQDRRKIQELAKHPVLQHGLLLSSPVLMEQLPRYLRKAPTTFRQKEFRVEFSLLRYLTRSCFKTSPFSTFTHTGVMQLSDKNEDRTQPDPKNVKSSLHLNNHLFAYLNSMLLHHPELNELLLIKCNETVTVRDDKIRFLVNFNNIESFQQIPAAGLPMVIVNYVQKSETPLSLQTLADQLTEIVENAGRPDIKAYLFKLVSAGLLQAGTGISGIDPEWHTKTMDFLEKTGSHSPSVKTLKNLFEKLQECCMTYAQADTATRRTLLKTAETLTNETFEKLEKEGGIYSSEKKPVQDPGSSFEKAGFSSYRFSQKQLFYEDCHTPEKETLSQKQVRKFIAKTDAFLNHLLPLDLMRDERIKMASFFTRHYNREATVNIIDFYKDYYLLVKKPEKEQAEKAPLKKKDKTPWEKELSERIARTAQHQPEVLDLTKNLFDNLPVPETSPPFEPRYSRGIFVQFHTDENGGNGDLSGVINTVLPGMGKVSGRFLSLFDKEVTSDFVDYNNQLYPGIVKAELNDASSFNANIHPPLLHREVALPGGNNIYPPNQQIQVNDLHVRYDPDTGFLKLVKDGKQVFTYDLCLESFYNRSKLYQMMAHFNPDARLSPKSLVRLVDTIYIRQDKDRDCYVLPRITYEKNVIIRRKTWNIKRSAVPQQEQEETDFAYYMRLNTWRQSHSIPEQVFLFLRKRPVNANQPSRKNTSVKTSITDDYKPQYISFVQPVLVGFFKRLISRADPHISFEEVLPELPVSHPDPDVRVKEYLIQWYKY